MSEPLVSVAVGLPTESSASTRSSTRRDLILQHYERPILINIPVAAVGNDGIAADQFKQILKEDLLEALPSLVNVYHMRSSDMFFELYQPKNQELWKNDDEIEIIESNIVSLTMNQIYILTKRNMIKGRQLIIAVLTLSSQSSSSTGSGRYMPTLGTVSEGGNSQAHLRDIAVEESRYRGSPSTGAQLKGRMAVQTPARADRVYNYRPIEIMGPPIVIYERVFAEFLQDMDTHTPTPAELKVANQFVAETLSFYKDESERESSMASVLRNSMGIPLVDTPFTFNGTFKPDGARTCSALGSFQPFAAIFELKNEIGEGSCDPSAQAECVYAAVYLSDAASLIRQVSHCPAFLVGMAGPNIIVSGAVFAEGLINQTLTDYISIIPRLNKNERSPFDDAAYRVAKLFYALKKGIDTLDQYYSLLVTELTPSLMLPNVGSGPNIIPKITAQRRNPTQPKFIGPHFCEYKDHTNNTVRLIYKKRLHDIPQRSVFIAEAHRDKHQQPIKIEVIVKFAYRYNRKAHELLASSNCAPKLLFCERRDDLGGLWVIVMEHIKGKYPGPDNPMSDFHIDQLRAALKLLHNENLVFGDLREPNILINDQRMMLIDLDWCGEAGKAQYPSDILLEPGKFHDDVQQGGLLEIGHDQYLFRDLTGQEL